MWLVGLVLLTLRFANAQLRVDPLVTSSAAGLIRGLQADDGDYAMFLGIPYAQVDKNNPFGASTPQPKFDTIFDAIDDSAVCPQREEFNGTVVGTLDCLQINVYVPNKATSRNRMPVLVWIYGGSFSIGFSNRYLYGPKYLVRNDIILVTFNYRVGPYGFFCLDIPEIPGNQGLKDQVLALRWINNNIAAFGGDVNRITVMGQSAGAAAIDFHMLSKNEKLFDQAILQSGTSLVPVVLDEPRREKAFSIANKLGLITEDIYEAVAFLAKTEPKIVIEATEALGLISRPCVEQVFENVDSILTDYPINMDVPKVKDTPILIGFNNKELMASYANKPADQFKIFNDFDFYLRWAFVDDEKFNEMEDIVRRFYIGDENLSEEVRDNLIDFSSDFVFVHPIQMSMGKFLENGAGNLYYYMFSYSGNRNFVKKRQKITMPGAAHADEISYLFDISYETEAPSEADQRMIDQLTTLWTNFVKYGNPTPETSKLLPVTWPPITEQTFTYMSIDSELSVSSRPYYARTAFWDLFYDFNKYRIKGNRKELENTKLQHKNKKLNKK